MIKRIAILVASLATALTLHAQSREEMSRHDRARYNQMNSQGVWNVGVNISPVVGISHPLSTGGRMTATGWCGMGIEVGYFVVDNMRLYAEFDWVSNGYKNMFNEGGYDQLSATDFILGAQWHIGRLALGGGLLLGNTHYTVVHGIMEEPKLPTYHDRRRGFGLDYNLSYMLSPFFKVGAYYRPHITQKEYAHTLGAKITIYLPFINAVVCR